MIWDCVASQVCIFACWKSWPLKDELAWTVAHQCANAMGMWKDKPKKGYEGGSDAAASSVVYSVEQDSFRITAAYYMSMNPVMLMIRKMREG